MVFKSVALMVRARGPDEFWRKRKIFKIAAHHFGRARNCYSITIKKVHRALRYATQAGEQKKKDMKELRTSRVTAGAEELGFNYPLLKEGLARSDVYLNNKILADLAVWEPRTFKALTQFAWARVFRDNIKNVDNLKSPPTNVVLRNVKNS